MSINSAVEAVLPGSWSGLIVALIIGVALLYARDPVRRWARLWLTFVTILYGFLSTQAGADAVSAPLRRHGQFLTTAAAARGATAVVLLTPSAGTYRSRGAELSQIPEVGVLRVLEAARVYRMLGEPWVILQGGFPELRDRPAAGAIARDALVRLGVPSDRILIEQMSTNTHEHPERLGPILQARDIRRFVLVTSPEHMWRASTTFSDAGYDFVPSASGPSELRTPRSQIWPSLRHLQESEAASHEYVGLLYYWLRGWR